MAKWIDIMLNNSLFMSVVILLLLLLSKLFFKRNSARWRYYTWLVVIVGLLIPFRPSFDIIPVRIEPPIQFSSQAISPVISKQPEFDGLQTNEAEELAAPVSLETSQITFDWPMVVAAVWVAGFLLSLVYCFLKHREFLKAVRRWKCDFDKENIYELLDNANAELGITKRLEVKTCKIVSTPMLVGLIKPVILLPPNDFEYDELELIIRHELTHYKRKDLWYKALVLFTTAVHWFNPLVYIMAWAVTADCEMSCDESVLKDKGMQQRMLYGETIISIIKNQSSVSTVFSTGFKGGKKIMEKRMFTIMDTAKKKMGLMVLCIALACTVLTGMTSSANAQQPQKPNMPSGQKSENLSQYDSSIIHKIENGQITIPISISQIKDSIVCLGQVPDISHAISVEYDITCDSGKQLGAGLTTGDIEINSRYTWYNSHVTSGNPPTLKQIQLYDGDLAFKPTHTGNYFVYVIGDFTPDEDLLTNVKGHIIIKYDTSATPDNSTSEIQNNDIMLWEPVDGRIEIPVSIDRLVDEAICLGDIPDIRNAKTIEYQLTCESGPLSVYLLAENVSKNTLLYGMTVSEQSGGLPTILEQAFIIDYAKLSIDYSNYIGNYSVFVGAPRFGHYLDRVNILENVKGTIVIEYN